MYRTRLGKTLENDGYERRLSTKNRHVSLQPCTRGDRLQQSQKGGMCHPSHAYRAHPNFLRARWGF